MTLVTDLRGSKLSCAYAVNTPPTWKTEPGPVPDSYFTYLVPGEVFDREQGKRIALGRLRKKRAHDAPFSQRQSRRYEMEYSSSEKPIITALTRIADDLRTVNIVGRRIARHELDLLLWEKDMLLSGSPVRDGKEEGPTHPTQLPEGSKPKLTRVQSCMWSR
jgi:hypothetical protein